MLSELDTNSTDKCKTCMMLIVKDTNPTEKYKTYDAKWIIY